MFLLGFRRKLTALTLCKSIESAIQWFQIHHGITFATIQNLAVYLSGARVSIFSTLVPRLRTFITERWDVKNQMKQTKRKQEYIKGKVIRPGVIKLFFMLNSTEHDIYRAHKYYNANNCWHLNIYYYDQYNI